MTAVILFPRQTHPAIEERYAAWQVQLLLRRQIQHAVIHEYDPKATASQITERLSGSHALVVTEPLLVVAADLADRLSDALEKDSKVFAAVPLANESGQPRQSVSATIPYLTLRQFEDSAAATGMTKRGGETIVWDSADPAIYLCRLASLQSESRPLSSVLAGKSVALVPTAYVHRYASQRGQLRCDLLDRVPKDARTILEFGCGEAPLGEALKKRQPCRVVGIELDPEAAAIARTRIDQVHSGDVREILMSIGEKFDWIVGGDILEHLDEPWTFLRELRKLSVPGGHLLLSLPNVASWPIVTDLLRGRFDYVYLGILCAGHLRFFTRRSIEEMLEISGWKAEQIEPQEPFITPEFETFLENLRKAGIEHSAEDLATPGYYVVAKC